MYYVSMTDKVLSGWGRATEKICKVVIKCASVQEARIVKDNASYRGDMKHINIITTKPRYNKNTHYTSYHDNSDYANWFKKDYFNK